MKDNEEKLNENLIENEKTYQKRKIYLYLSLLAIIILLLLQCSPREGSKEQTPPSLKIKSIEEKINKEIKTIEPIKPTIEIIKNKKEIIKNVEEKVIKNKREIIKEPIIKEELIKIKKIVKPSVITPPIIVVPAKQIIPVGFENIEETLFVKTYIDVVINNKKIGILKAKYDKDNLYIQDMKLFNTYLNVFKFKNQILSNIKENNVIQKEIKGELYTSLFDDNEETLYLNNYDKKIDIENKSAFIPDSNSDLSIIQNINSSYNDNDSLEYNIGGDLTISKKEHKIITNWNKSQDNFFVNNLYYNFEERDNSYSLGYFNYNSQNSLVIGDQFLGFEYSKNNKKLNKDNNKNIIIQIQQTSIVKFYKDEKLLLTKKLEQGTHYINTKTFPEGSYYIDIVIDDGFNTLEKREFIKNINPTNYFTFNMGVLKDKEKDILYDTKDNLFLKINKSFEKNNIYITPEIFYSDDNIVFNNNINYNLNNFYIDSNIMLGNKNSKGFNVNLGYQKENHYFNYTNYYLEKGENIFVEQDNKSHYFNYNYNHKKYGNLNLFYNKNNLSQNKEEGYGLKYRNNFKLKLNHAIDYSLGLSRINNENFFSLSVSYRFGTYKNNFESTLNNINGQYSSQNQYNYNFKEGNNHHRMFSSANFVENEDNVYQAGYQWNNHNYGYFEHNFSYKDNLSYYGNISTNIGYNKEKIGYGGKYNSGSGILVNIKSEKNNDYYLIINNSKIRVNSNKSTFIPLTPYETYEVSLEPVESNINDYIDKNKRKINLSKGNIESFTWEAKENKILISKLTYNGKVIKNQSFFLNNEVYISDNQGIINANVFLGENILEFDNFKCTITIKENNKDVIFENETICNEKGKE